jgi:hypothetical protein
VDWNFTFSSFSAMYDRKLNVSYLRPFNVFTARNILTSSDPNLVPAAIQHFSLFGAVMDSFCKSAPSMSSSFGAAIISKIQADS